MTEAKDYKELIGEHLMECVTIDELAIQEEYIRLPADLAYWGARYAQADRAYLLARLELERLERQLFGQIRASLLEAGEKRPTEAMVNSAIGESQEWIDAKRALIDAEVCRQEMRSAVEALKAKREVIVSLGAHLRLEMERDPILREQVKDARRQQREQADAL